MNHQETPVLLLTGYLGSGKTTLLNRILANERGIKFAVIVNDIGEVNIDASLIQQGGIVGQDDDSLVALQNGCICCTLKMDLVKQLNDIISTRQFDYIVIEASGICEPAPIAQTISTYPKLLAPEALKNGAARLDAIVTVVDALRMRDEFGLGEELKKKDMGEEDLASLVIQQIEFCNIILLNKAAEISPEDLGHLKGIIREIQPQATILECNYGDVELDKILNTHAFDFEKVATSARWIEAMEDEDEELENEESGEALEYGIQTFVYRRRPAMNLGRFDEMVSSRWPRSIIRAKGICYFRDEPDTCYLFEQSGRQFNITNAGQWYATMPKDELEQFKERNPSVRKDWDEQYGDRMQKIVFIGQDMDRKAIEAELDKCLED
ncbi:putative GTPase, G3E family [Prevotella dentalis DSM 3688]|uniref:Cobalamin synthesis protein/P47K family protein n=1 Tax=Prevotella dentalis (strain ATCC 49559 / DSM 3688 / JCM 13448 / NCTC 12043 / ES 2772) TaxID=908937 RepID=F9D080_PREDD|nr:GTP-binding protein [Prevotella dentalis]AGB27884.1 putative GTPase, G3E family [Prevotella dentalis DSM 3688]EGQ17173.1 cobalamin synthesis protein/P47K family protein [Prevotella dentalis DSM 3688]